MQALRLPGAFDKWGSFPDTSNAEVNRAVEFLVENVETVVETVVETNAFCVETVVTVERGLLRTTTPYGLYGLYKKYNGL